MRGQLKPLQGDVYWADLDPTVGHEQAGRRPVLVVSEDRYNGRSGMVVMVPLTTKGRLPPPLALGLGTIGGERESFALPAQVRALSVSRLRQRIEGGRLVDVERCLDALLQICGRRPPIAGSANDG